MNLESHLRRSKCVDGPTDDLIQKPVGLSFWTRSVVPGPFSGAILLQKLPALRSAVSLYGEDTQELITPP